MNLNSLNIEYLAKEKYPENKRIESIKHRATNQILSLLPNDINDETYSVVANDQCLWVYNDDYRLRPCATNLGKQILHPQYFEAKKIITSANEQRYMGKKATLPDSLYPYTALIHKTTQHCLTYNPDGLFVSPCDPDNQYQKWDVSPDKNMCLME
jgi:WD40 repeat protein